MEISAVLGFFFSIQQNSNILNVLLFSLVKVCDVNKMTKSRGVVVFERKYFFHS